MQQIKFFVIAFLLLSLHSITHGRGTHRERFHGYAEAPADVAAKVAAEHKKETTGEAE